ncbi:hypothetical protein [Maridesulfovibrio sp.]|uniref:hypothetical protein n=1 Tax=Maridesulfovibrio sp. TaxID=2795000 RepID=UPI002AA794A0|nr:hypothetical protein [Maridesulfovibrio sp.]
MANNHKYLHLLMPRCGSVAFTYSLVVTIYILIVLAFFLILANAYVGFSKSSYLVLDAKESAPIITQTNLFLKDILNEKNDKNLRIYSEPDEKISIKKTEEGDNTDSKKVIYTMHNSIVSFDSEIKGKPVIKLMFENAVYEDDDKFTGNDHSKAVCKIEFRCTEYEKKELENAFQLAKRKNKTKAKLPEFHFEKDNDKKDDNMYQGSLKLYGKEVSSIIKNVSEKFKKTENYSSLQKIFYTWIPYVTNSKSESFGFKLFFVFFSLITGGGALCVGPFIKEKNAQAYACGQTCAIRVFLVPFIYLFFGIGVACFIGLGSYYDVVGLILRIVAILIGCLIVLTAKKLTGLWFKKRYRFDYFHKCKASSEKYASVYDFMKEVHKIKSADNMLIECTDKVAHLSSALIALEDEFEEGTDADNSPDKNKEKHDKFRSTLWQLKKATAKCRKILKQELDAYIFTNAIQPKQIKTALAAIAKLMLVHKKIQHYYTEPFYKRYEYSKPVRYTLRLLIVLVSLGIVCGGIYNLRGILNEKSINLSFIEYVHYIVERMCS